MVRIHRSSIALIATVVLSFSHFFGLSAEAASDQFTKAEMHKVVQVLLSWTGDYDGAIDGLRGPKTNRGLDAIARRHGIGKRDGDGLYDVMIASARKVVTSSGYSIVRDQELDVVFGLPTRLLQPVGPSEQAQRLYRSKDELVELQIEVLDDNISLKDLYQRLRNVPGINLSRDTLTPDWFIVAGKEGDRRFFIRYHLSPSDGIFKGFAMRYPEGYGENLDRITAAMSHDFRTGADTKDHILYVSEYLTNTKFDFFEALDTYKHPCSEAEEPSESFEQCTVAIAEYTGDDPAALAWLYYFRGLASGSQHEFEAAIADYRKAIDLAPKFAEAYAARAHAYAASDQFEHVIMDLNAAASLDPVALVLIYRGRAYMDKSFRHLAINDFTKALQSGATGEEAAEAYMYRGLAHLDLEQMDSALFDLEQSLIYWPKDDDRRAETIEWIEELRSATQPVTNVMPVLPDELGEPVKTFSGDGATVSLYRFEFRNEAANLITIRGALEYGDDRFLRNALLSATEPRIFVSLESPGGSLDAGIKIGRAIWLHEAATVVEDGECASACALAWLAGRPRYKERGSRIGFHAPSERTEIGPRRTSAGSAVVEGYLRNIGMTSWAIEYINEADPDEMQWLSRRDAEHLNIVYRDWQAVRVPRSGAASATKRTKRFPGEDAVYVEQSRSNPEEISELAATVEWEFLENESYGPAINALVNVPERDLVVRVAFREIQNNGPDPGYLIEVQVDNMGDAELDSVPEIILKPDLNRKGTSLIGSMVEVTANQFWIGLSEDGPDEAFNLSLIRDRDWIDIPLIFKDGRQGNLNIQKGDAGARLFEQAMTAWANETD